MSLIDARALEDGTRLKADVCIVGAGAAGITLALELETAGYQVLLVESSDFKPDEATQSLYHLKSVCYPPWANYMSRAHYFGGSCSLWAGRCMPFREIDFAARPWVPHSGWPISLSDLECYYPRAVAILGLPPFDNFEPSVHQSRLTEAERSLIHGRDLATAISLWARKPKRFGYGERSTLRPFATELPELGLALVVAMSWFVATRFRDALPDLLRHPGAVLIYWTVIAGLLNVGSTTSRYWFPLLPVLYTFLALVLIDLARRVYPARGADAAAAAGSAVFLGLFALGPDFHPRHLLDPGAAAVRYRTDDFARFLETWYPRYDVRSPAATIAGRGPQAANARVVVDTLPALSYYLDVPHAVYLDRTQARFANVARAQGSLDMWSGQRLLSTPAEFADYAAGAEEVWLVRNVDPVDNGLDLEALPNGAFVVVERVVAGADRRIEIVRLRRQAEGQTD